MRKKRNKNKQIIVMSIVLVLLIIIAIAIYKKDNKRDFGSTEQQDEIVQDIFPYELEDGKLQVDSLFQYSGVNPDCNGEEGEDIAALSVTNLSSEYLVKADFTVTLSDGTAVKFVVNDLPAGKNVMTFSSENIIFEMENTCVEIKCSAEFEISDVVMEDKIDVATEGTAVTLTNKSDEDLNDLDVYCHCLLQEAYIGGLTYIYPVENIPAGESVTLEAVECYLGEADVVRINQGE